MWLSYEVFFKTFDKGILEKIFIKELIWGLVSLSNKIRFLATGDITQYLLLTSILVFGGIILFFSQYLQVTLFFFIFSYVVLVIFFTDVFKDEQDE